MSFGETLASLREAAGLTQMQLALQAGISVDNLRRWEQDRHLPRVDDAYLLAKALGVSVERLILAADMEPGSPAAQPQKPKKEKRGRKPKG
jgi:transcriptional regulator with XRE-family HTH domain